MISKHDLLSDGNSSNQLRQIFPIEDISNKVSLMKFFSRAWPGRVGGCSTIDQSDQCSAITNQLSLTAFKTNGFHSLPNIEIYISIMNIVLIFLFYQKLLCW